MTRAPYDFGEAIEKSNALNASQTAAEAETRRAYGQYAEAERAYREALAITITRLRADGASATLAADLARGDRHVAGLRYRRDVSEGVVEAAKQSGWRHQANRRDMHEMVRWSHHRDLAENGGARDEPQWT
ncbi:MAG: hypothetical protein JWQ48_2408, partial [Conexibacter sp.]|nr:hypothetical protein [Conexibacter sp.]